MTSPSSPALTSPTAYDAVPYPSGAFDQTHPRRLATVASLFGLSAPPIAAARVLELGCASGGNLLPMALELPGARFLGVDLSARQIAEGQRWIERLGLTNVRLAHGDILHLEQLAQLEHLEHLGPFDYIIAHGVFSWVPEPVQEKLLERCGALLAPDGVAYISYATYPGCHIRRVTRDLMRFHTRAIPDTDPPARAAQARAVLGFAANAVPKATALWSGLLQGELARILKLSDELLLHDDLSDLNEPIYFHEFIARASRHGLKYLGEALFSDMQDHLYRPEVRDMLRQSGDRIVHEQYLDFLNCRAFRQTLLCREGTPLRLTLGPEDIMRYHVHGRGAPVSTAMDLRSEEPARFKNPAGVVVGMGLPLAKAALVHLWERAPQPLPFEAVLAGARARLGREGEASREEALELGEALLAAYSGDMVELCREPPRPAWEPGERPAASPLARLQAMEGTRVTSLLHQNVVLDEPFAHAVVQLLDGTRDRAALIEALAARVAEGRLTIEGEALDGDEAARAAVEARLSAALGKMGRIGLLIA